jgi:16S rRNA (guanine527-N7)-methyltransferase
VVTCSEREILRRTAGGLGVELREVHLSRLMSYLDELCIWNRHMNLTGLRSRERMVVELLADSLVPAPLIPPNARLLDVGSGAGLPGVPLKIVRPDLLVELLEPSLKRYHFLRQVIRILGMKGIEAVRGRAGEPSAPLQFRDYDVVTARAVSDLEKTVTLCSPLVAPGGILVGFGGRHAEAVLDKAGGPPPETGMRLEKNIRYMLPGALGERHALFFRKAATSPTSQGR